MRRAGGPCVRADGPVAGADGGPHAGARGARPAADARGGAEGDGAGRAADRAAADGSLRAAGAVEHEQAHAWAGHVARAARQCRRSSLPHLLAPATLDEFLASPLFATTDLRLFLDDRGDPAASADRAAQADHPVRRPRGRLLGCRAPPARRPGPPGAWVLGGRVLRAETAVLVGLTAVHMTWGISREADAAERDAGAERVPDPPCITRFVRRCSFRNHEALGRSQCENSGPTE